MQGAGKGTLGKAVAAKYGMTIFETGGALRKLAKEDSELGKKIKSIIEAGHLVPNEVVMEIVEDFMNKLEKDSPILFDGISPIEIFSIDSSILFNDSWNFFSGIGLFLQDILILSF